MPDLTSKDIDKYTTEELKEMLNKKELIAKQKSKKKRKIKLADWLVPFIVLVNIIFTIVVLILFRETSSEPSTLIERWFLFTTVELISMAGIQVSKNIGEDFGGDK